MAFLLCPRGLTTGKTGIIGDGLKTGGLNMKDENGKIVFDEEEQAKVDEIVKERLARHKPEDYDDLNELAKELEDFGYSGTPAEKKAAVMAYKDEIKKQQELEALQKEAETTGKDPELMATIKALKDELKEIKGERQAQKQAEEQKKTAEEDFKKEVEEFQEKYPDVDLDKLGENQKFSKFFQRSNPKLTLMEVYEDFVDMVGGAEAEAIAKLKSNIDRSTSSGRAKGDSAGGSYNLSAHQQQLAKENGMTNKEYAELLGNIKK